MIRKFIPLSTIYIYDEIHRETEGGFEVDEAKDGKTTAEHREGADYIKAVLQKGAKILPILVLDNDDGTYTRLDGFKRAVAYKELGYKYVEAFICTQQEFRGAEFVPFGPYQMRAWHGGQDGEAGKFPLLEGGEAEDFNYDQVKFLYKNDAKPHGIRIEVADTIHVHWGQLGQFRWDLGRRDFLALAEAISNVDG